MEGFRMTQHKTPPGDEQPHKPEEQSSPEEQHAPARKRPGQQWSSLVEERIREAMERGEFNDLAGEGQPLDLDENPYAGDRALAFHLLKSQHHLPPELELGREIDNDLKRAEALLAEFRRRRDDLKRRERASLSSDPLARWRLPGTSEAQRAYQTLREEYATRYEAALRQVRSKILTLNIIAPSALHRPLIDIDAHLKAFEQAFPPTLG
jgi:DnaJ family protein C protein 28